MFFVWLVFFFLLGLRKREKQVSFRIGGGGAL